ncbi:hypothetical protein BZJ19_11650 [Salinivibrio proteolyticus]|uniref:hypothetical protein n=1 Tax=Salinivibrio proteolyticus TaxID=334715 RepID=UPI0009893E03|nr:hypothetical protein [Salinivibrio proteolyticus]OOF24026.1 hypothetical protein BZJ19_11650 [Salinivibrio proteolyticus]
MSTTHQFVYESVLDNKRFLKSQKNLERSIQRFETRVQKLKADTARKEIQHEQSVQAAIKRSETVKRGELDKTAVKQQRELQKQQRKQAAFEKWKLTQFRSTAFQRLSLEQQINVKRILSSKKSEEEIRDEFQKTTQAFKRELQQRKAYEKRQRSVGGGSGAGGAAVAARGGAMGGMAGGLLALASNPVALGVGATVGAGAMLVNAGADQFKDLQRGSELTGVGVQQLQRDAFVASNLTGMSTEAYTDKLKDVNEKSKDFRANSEFDAKSGQFKGGGEGVDAANAMLQAGLKPSEVKALFSQQDPTKIIDSLNKTLANADVGTRTLAFEGLANDLTGLANALQNTERRQAAEQTYDSLNLGFSDQDLAKIKEATKATDSFFSVIANAPLQAFKSFASNLSPETLEMLGKIGELIVNVAGIIGDVLSVALNTLSPILNPLLDVLNWVVRGLKAVTGAWADFVSGFHPITAALEILDKIFKKVFGISLTDSFKGFIEDWENGLSMVFGFLKNSFKGWIADLINFLPDWLKTDNMKKWAEGGDDMPKTASTTKPVTPRPQNTMPSAASSYNLRAQAAKAQQALPTPETTQNAYAARVQAMQRVQVQNQANVTLNLDGEQIANVVVDSQQFNEGTQRAMRNAALPNY